MTIRDKKGQFVKGSHHNKGMIRSNETKRKMSLAQKGRYPISEETRMKMSLSHKGQIPWNRGKRIGNISWNWAGGVTSKDEIMRTDANSRLWRKTIFARDDWTCQKCKARGKRLHSHHIQNFAQYRELRFIIDNGITFCDNCHKEFHRKFGLRNNNEEQIMEFLN